MNLAHTGFSLIHFAPTLLTLPLSVCAGNLWEELKDDSLAPDPVTTTSVSPSSNLSSPRPRDESLRSLGLAGADVSGPRPGEGDPGGLLHLSITAHYSTTFANMDSMSTNQPTFGDFSIPLV